MNPGKEKLKVEIIPMAMPFPCNAHDLITHALEKVEAVLSKSPYHIPIFVIMSEGSYYLYHIDEMIHVDFDVTYRLMYEAARRLSAEGYLFVTTGAVEKEPSRYVAKSFTVEQCRKTFLTGRREGGPNIPIYIEASFGADWSAMVMEYEWEEGKLTRNRATRYAHWQLEGIFEGVIPAAIS
jgi:hypothetical protein